ncbi:cupin domain-containing protein [Mesorhizobium sp. RMAD-H1]|uniref:cupin domain-containing protein n=1 Tax=Mesorhizobium sp. RMAD-H1 TaxID=2587065 RepID=UPI001620F109|nr:cupin domain-containing protein [Mesorhizobium sp. RMAD-H1]MBB2970504.1 hypothetical protein [Mesorhizobium sp. RMAD-H1]
MRLPSATFCRSTLPLRGDSGGGARRHFSGSRTFCIWNIGIREAIRGKWRIQYDEWEFCHVLSGISVITQERRPAVTLRAGDSFVLRPGFGGTWEVIETTRKM